MFIIFILFTFQSLCAIPLAEQFKQTGYLEICDKKYGIEKFDSLYAHFDKLIEFLQTNPVWAQKLYIAKERFIRSKAKHFYSTDFFSFYDESTTRGQISFYYSMHFHEFIYTNYKEFKQVPEIIRFFEICLEIQKPYGDIFNEAANELGIKTIFSSKLEQPPILFKIIKYLPSYIATKPHYDGTAFSLFLDSTDNQSLLLSSYKALLKIDDFSSPARTTQTSILLIPGSFLSEFSIYPTPHIVTKSGKTRYATIAFAMRPNYISQITKFATLPNF
ncbi:MAG: hypothetical protein P4L22_04800 [Candidatus Babeliales bacterium]|nr:hypothetical protein [Candidatus Babeliales bacterium]